MILSVEATVVCAPHSSAHPCLSRLMMLVMLRLRICDSMISKSPNISLTPHRPLCTQESCTTPAAGASMGPHAGPGWPCCTGAGRASRRANHRPRRCCRHGCAYGTPTALQAHIVQSHSSARAAASARSTNRRAGTCRTEPSSAPRRAVATSSPPASSRVGRSVGRQAALAPGLGSHRRCDLP